MDFKNFNSTWQSTIANNRMLVVSNLAAIAALTMSVTALTSSKERIVIMPPHVSERVVVAWNEASPSYSKSIASWLSGVIGGVSENNLAFAQGTIEQFFKPELKKELLIKLSKIAKDPLRKIAGATVWFEATTVEWEQSTNKVFVAGDLVSVSPSQAQPNRDPVTYEYTIEIQNGLPMVVAFNSYRGPARTVAWLRDNRILGIGGENATDRVIEEENVKQRAEEEL
jgi:conjugal transfer pilus assembly protein TraE